MLRYVLSAVQLASVPFLVDLPTQIEPFDVVRFDDGTVEIRENQSKKTMQILGGIVMILAGVALFIWKATRTGEWRTSGPAGGVGLAYGVYLLSLAIAQETAVLDPTKQHLTVYRLLGEKFVARDSIDGIALTIRWPATTKFESSLAVLKERELVMKIAEASFIESETRAVALLDFAVWFATTYELELIIRLQGRSNSDPIPENLLGNRLRALIEASTEA